MRTRTVVGSLVLLAVVVTAVALGRCDTDQAPVVDGTENVGSSRSSTATSPREAEREPVQESAVETPEPPPPEDAPDAMPESAFRVEDTAGVPIEDARIAMIASDGELLASGSTDERGEWRAATPELPETVTVAAEKASFAARRIRLSARPADPTVIVLPAATSIAGRVVVRGGGAPPNGTRVVAWPPRFGPSLAELATGTRPTPGILTAPCDDAGHFVITGAAADAVYTVAAGLGGWTTPEVAKRVPGGSGGVRLELCRVFATVVKAVDADDDLVPHTQGGSWGEVEPDGVDWRSLRYPSVELALAGLDDLDSVRDDTGFFDWRQRLLAYAAAPGPTELGGVVVRYQVPGYDVAHLHVRVPVLEESPFVQHVRLRSTSAGFGELELRFVGGVAGEGLADDLRRPKVLLELFSVSEPGVNLQLQVTLAQRQTVSGIPFGAYRARVVMPHAVLPTADGAPIDIGPELTRFDVDGSRLGSVLVRPLDLDDGSERWSRWTARVRPSGASDSRSPTSRLPGLIPGLRAGSYDVEVTVTTPSGSRRQTFESVEIQPGGVTELFVSRR